MKKVKIAYWITTTLVSLMMLMSAFMYFTSPNIGAGFHHLGFPSYFRIELGIAKLLGVIVLIVPAISSRIKEWAYIGFFITFISALIAHVASGDPANVWASVLVAIALLATSYFTYHRMIHRPAVLA